MQGAITLIAGKYKLANAVWFEVQQDDRGIKLSLRDEKTNVCYSAVVDGQGVVIDGSIGPITGEWDGKVEQPRPSYGQWYQLVPSALEINSRWREASKDPLACFPAFAKHKFTLRHGPSAREHRHVRPIAGYEGDGGTYVLYRRPSYRNDEQLMRLLDNGRVNIADDTDPNRMPPEEWARFLQLTPRKHFTLNGQQWQKMTQADLAAAVGGKIFEVWAVETDLPENK